jgi:hypothetical protein
MTLYPPDLDVRPLTTWPGALTTERTRAPFSAGLTATLEVLQRELRALGARNPVLEVAIPADQFRIDGRPRANARETHPGVVLSLPTTDVGPLRYATDTFDRWQDNLRAIALGLEALRRVDRYGITKRGEQYAGFKALPSGATAMPAGGLTVEEAARVLSDLAAGPGPNGLAVSPDKLVTSPAMRRLAYHAAATRHHPDRGGARQMWDRLEQAKRVLDEHGGRP